MIDAMETTNERLNNIIINITSLAGISMKYRYSSENRELLLESIDGEMDDNEMDDNERKFFFISKDDKKIIFGFFISQEQLSIIDNIGDINNTDIYSITYIKLIDIFDQILGTEYIENMKSVLFKLNDEKLKLNNEQFKQSDEYKKLFDSTYAIKFHNIYYLICFLYSKNLDYIFSYILINFSFKFLEAFPKISQYMKSFLVNSIIINGLYNSIKYLNNNYVDKMIIEKKLRCITISIFAKKCYEQYFEGKEREFLESLIEEYKRIPDIDYFCPYDEIEFERRHEYILLSTTDYEKIRDGLFKQISNMVSNDIPYIGPTPHEELKARYNELIAEWTRKRNEFALTFQ
jgi:hypothetical protein